MNDKTNPEHATKPQCETDCDENATGGPVTEGGGLTGAGNLSANAASRTGGATSGTPRAGAPEPKNAVPPSA